MDEIYKFLADHQIKYERHDHPPVFTVEDVNRLVPPLPAAKTKSLFLRDNKGQRHFLVVVRGEKRVDLKALPGLLKSSRLRFGSSDRLKQFLGVDPGSVSLFSVVNDLDHAVEVIIDDDLWESEAFQFHPLVNTSTLVIFRDSLQRFLDKTGHKIQILDVPGCNYQF
jgi:Ala-tRNA(Pro) deacylase